jgi:hypothetical protein
MALFVTEDVLGKFREWQSRGVRFRHTPRLRRIKCTLIAARCKDDSTSGGRS